MPRPGTAINVATIAGGTAAGLADRLLDVKQVRAGPILPALALTPLLVALLGR